MPGLRASKAQAFLEALRHGTPFQGPASWNLQVHTADPGPAGIIAVANAGRRLNFSWGAPDLFGHMFNAAGLTFGNTAGPVGATVDYTFGSFWDDVDPGQGFCWGTAVLGANPVPVGNDLFIAAGKISVVVPIMGS